MLGNYKIAISVPTRENADGYFSIRLKGSMDTERSEYRRPERMFIVSDIEGNFNSFCKLLYRAKVVNKRLQWIFGDNHLVILGDCFDRGMEVAECLWLIYSLEERAKKQGGYVHFILGNHEIMNMNGDWRYIHPKYAQRRNGDIAAIYSGNNELWRWLRTKNVIEKVGDVLFVHAGISNDLIELQLGIDAINEIARLYYNNAENAFENLQASIIYANETSPFWYRGYYQSTVPESLIDATLKHFNVSTIVTGHTLIDHINTFYNGKVINVNTNHSMENSEGLLIADSRLYRVKTNGDAMPIK